MKDLKLLVVKNNHSVRGRAGSQSLVSTAASSPTVPRNTREVGTRVCLRFELSEFEYPSLLSTTIYMSRCLNYRS